MTNAPVAAVDEVVVQVRDVCMGFAKPSGELLPVLGGVNLTLRKGEILGLLGRSGSGKSTLLRIIDGLMKPTSGQVICDGSPVTEPPPGMAMVFQTFALLPWLTVLENVESSLNALGLPAAAVRDRALKGIERIGLNGFESAYPRELSGGMRQRVGFARALVIEPKVLLMDEPFSALDVLTAETLRTDFIDLWSGGQLPTQSVLLVTHNIEEAVLLCDRILILSSKPAHITAEIHVDLPQPRNRLDTAFRYIVDELYSTLTSRTVESLEEQVKLHGARMQPLPDVSIYAITRLIETLAAPPYQGCGELVEITHRFHAPHYDPLPVALALHILELGELKNGAITLTAAGHVFAQTDADKRPQLLKEHLLHFVPLAAHIRQVLDDRDVHRAPRVRFQSELEDHLSREDADRTLRTLIGWARYTSLFAYDDRSKTFSLPPGL